MTVRSILFGALGAAAICGLTYCNDYVLRQTYLVGNHMPVSVFGSLIIVLVLNAGLYRFRATWALRGRELATILAMTLAACAIPSSGFMRTFPTVVMMPQHYQKTNPGWARYNLTEELALDRMLPDTQRVVHRGKIVAAKSDSAILEPQMRDWTQRKIRVHGPGNMVQVRRITGWSEDKASVEVDKPWRLTPDAGTAYDILESSEDESLTPFLYGRQDKSEVGNLFSAIPWSAWKRSLLFWVPAVLALWIALVGLSLVVHQQWSKHEQLPYPLATFAGSLLPDGDGRAAAVFRDKRFWLVTGIVFAFYMNNYVATWYPDHWFTIPNYVDIEPMMQLLPIKGMVSWGYGKATVYLSVVAISYFLASDVSFSVGVGPLLYGFLGGVAMAYGFDLRGGSGWINPEHFFAFGAFFGMTCMILYTGRRYYKTVARRTLFMRAEDELPTASVIGGRVLLVGAMIFAGLLMWVGLRWYLALLYTIGIIMMYMVMGRIIAETGLFFMQSQWAPSAIIIGVLGVKVLDPHQIFAMFILCAVLAVDPRETLMPFLINGLKLGADAEGGKGKVGRVSIAVVAALVLGFGVALPVTLGMQYTRGVNFHDMWGTKWVPDYPCNETVQICQRMDALDQFNSSFSTNSRRRERHIVNLQ